MKALFADAQQILCGGSEDVEMILITNERFKVGTEMPAIRQCWIH